MRSAETDAVTKTCIVPSTFERARTIADRITKVTHRITV